MSRHYLTQIDLQARTAVCSVCGPTDIHVSRPRAANSPEIYCFQRVRESRALLRESRRKRSAGYRRHHLTEINPERRTADCAICGPIAVYELEAGGHKVYRCPNHVPMDSPRQGSVHPINPFARVHLLSRIDEQNNTAICAKCGPVRLDWNAIPSFQALEAKNERVQENARIVHEYIRRRACKRCNNMAIVEPNGFYFFERHLPKGNRIVALLERADPEDLLAELDRRDLYCKKCLKLINSSFASNTPVPEFRPFPTFF